MADLTPLDSRLFELLSITSENVFIYIADLERDYSRWSPGAVEFFGLPSEYIENTAEVWVEYIHPEDRSIFLSDMGRIFEGTSNRHRCEYRAQTAEGEYVWVRCAGIAERKEDGTPGLFAGTLTNLGSASKFDPITGLLSPYEFSIQLQEILDEKRSGALLMLGIDDFKRINDIHGYTFGDAVLRNLYQSLQEIPHATLFRMDGDKCAVLLPNSGKAECRWVFDKACEAASELVPINGVKPRISLSGGAVLFPDHGHAPDIIRTNAEYALEQAKKERRGSMAIYSEELHTKELHLFKIKEVLRRAIDNNFKGFSLHYQPQIRTETGKVCGAEALLRFQDPLLPSVGPADIIPVLEESGAINEVGAWVLRTALEQVREWREIDPHFHVSVNVSYEQMKRPDFRSVVLREIERSGVSSDALVLELTESRKITDPEKLRNDFMFFAEHNIVMALDDFGTGYATIAMLRELIPPLIKIDHISVACVAESSLDLAIIEYVLQLCKRTSIRVCVEGVENERILEVIEPHKPDLMQGYYFSRPIPSDEFEQRFLKAC